MATTHPVQHATVDEKRDAVLREISLLRGPWGRQAAEYMEIDRTWYIDELEQELATLDKKEIKR